MGQLSVFATAAVRRSLSSSSIPHSSNICSGKDRRISYSIQCERYIPKCSIRLGFLLQIVERKFLSGATALQGLGQQSGRRRSAKLVPTFADRGVSRGQRNGSPRPLISVYRTWIATYFIQVAP